MAVFRSTGHIEAENWRTHGSMVTPEALHRLGPPSDYLAKFQLALGSIIVPLTINFPPIGSVAVYPIRGSSDLSPLRLPTLLQPSTQAPCTLSPSTFSDPNPIMTSLLGRLKLFSRRDSRRARSGKNQKSQPRDMSAISLPSKTLTDTT